MKLTRSTLLSRFLSPTFSLVILPAALLACESVPEFGGTPGGGDTKGTGGGTVGGGNTTIDFGGASGDGDGDVEPPAPAAVCGNEELEPGELCDDGNTEDGDGCSADCLVQDPDFDCSEPGEPCKNTVICGNGVIEGDEACDDGNETSSDGCAGDCAEVEAGFDCTRPGRACVGVAVCGNGVRERGEQCDDGQEMPVAGDGCDAECQQEPGFFCTVPGQACVALVCGNGVRTPDEECDDGQDPPLAGDGCSATCTVEEGYRCNASGCATVCGDGLVRGGEVCDDGDRQSGDGCSAACLEEPNWNCTEANANSASVCTSTIACGNGRVEPGEICETNQAGCDSDCLGFSPDPTAGAVCGNGIIEAGETCDAPNPGFGCAADCTVETDFTCPRPNTCFADPKCGDGILHSPLGEFCDDGNTNDSDGCSNQCVVNPDYNCYGLGPSVCVQETCGDGIRTPSEDCDDNNAVDGDGCSDCLVDDGYACPNQGEPCVEKCGDGKRVGDEECDDGNLINDDGCNSGCLAEPGYTCGLDTGLCETDVCGDGVQGPSEGCEDGNDVSGDGCSATCQNEPTVTVGPDPTVVGSCGDGILVGDEACDDGNNVDGDGCLGDCSAIEDDYECETFVKLPESVKIAVTYRDFLADSEEGGHPDFEWEPNPFMRNMPGPVCTTSNSAPCTAAAGVECEANTCARLDADGKPVHHLTGNDEQRGRVWDDETFALWFRNDNADDKEGHDGIIEMWHEENFLTLNQVGTSDAYSFDSGSHFPLDNKGLGNHTATRNYHFTSEIRYFFQYTGGETLTFRGDDDVWVFVNGRLAVDIGGVHGPRWGRVVLGDDGDGSASDSNCSSHGGNEPGACTLEAEELATGSDTTGIVDDKRFGLVQGELYEIVLFHAERHTSGSNFRLTLDGFLAPRSYCKPECGDGKLLPGEVCDDGEDDNINTDDGDPSNDTTGRCNDSCNRRAYCGDGEVNIGEVCDNGVNLDVYLVSSDPDACAPGCVLPPSCGDNEVQAAFESCDRGSANNDSSYGADSCTTECALGGYCGDGLINGGEACDEGAGNGGYGPGSCAYDCTAGPFCGDGVRNGSEECDGTVGCSATCIQGPYCGDGLTSDGEDCDWGQFASSAYGACTDTCEEGARCGDGQVQSDYEDCDNGDANDDDLYDGCTTTCSHGPRCGDGERQEEEGEECDNAFNDDTYAFNATSCGPGCKLPPSCGDGTVQATDELCDNGDENDDQAYEGCTTSCEWGPYCGDGELHDSETCDNGRNNTAYSAAGEACGYDCEPAPYCGDGERNGPEQCDDGADENVGGYGKCNPDCTRGPFCGDGIVQKDQGESCDGGITGSLSCSVLCARRDVVK